MFVCRIINFTSKLECKANLEIILETITKNSKVPQYLSFRDATNV